MENRLTTRRSPREGPGGSNMPHVGVADDGNNEDEKVYYGFGVFMGLPLADLKAMKDDFVEQQALTGGPPQRALPSSAAALESRTHRVEEEEAGYEHQEDARMAPSQQHARMPSGYERQHGEGPPREYAAERERGTRYTQGPPGGERGDRGSDGDSHSDDGSDEYGHKSHSLNFILH